MVAYLRSLDSKWQKQLERPEAVAFLLQIMSRYVAHRKKGPSDDARKIIWNGHVRNKNCLADWDSMDRALRDRHCPLFNEKDIMKSERNPKLCGPNAGTGKRDEGSDSCSLPPGGPGGGDGGKSIEWDEGPDSPECQSGKCGGELCTGYYCHDNVNGVPPDFRDPKDPNRGNTMPPGGHNGSEPQILHRNHLLYGRTIKSHPQGLQLGDQPLEVHLDAARL